MCELYSSHIKINNIKKSPKIGDFYVCGACGTMLEHFYLKNNPIIIDLILVN